MGEGWGRFDRDPAGVCLGGGALCDWADVSSVASAWTAACGDYSHGVGLGGWTSEVLWDGLCVFRVRGGGRVRPWG